MPQVNYTVVPDLPPVETSLVADPNPYLVANGQSDFITIPGLAGQPVAGPAGTQMDFVQLHAPASYRIIQFYMARLGDKPDLPDPDTGTDNEVLVHKHLGIPFVGRTISGVPLWVAFGLYVYGLKNPPTDTDRLSAGAPPFDSTPAGSYTFGPEDFVTTMFGDAPPVTKLVPDPTGPTLPPDPNLPYFTK